MVITNFLGYLIFSRSRSKSGSPPRKKKRRSDSSSSSSSSSRSRSGSSRSRSRSRSRSKSSSSSRSSRGSRSKSNSRSQSRSPKQSSKDSPRERRFGFCVNDGFGLIGIHTSCFVLACCTSHVWPWNYFCHILATSCKRLLLWTLILNWILLFQKKTIGVFQDCLICQPNPQTLGKELMMMMMTPT